MSRTAALVCGLLVAAATSVAAEPTRKWINESYNTTLVHVKGKEWAEIDNKTGKVKWSLVETSRTGESIELLNEVRGQVWRLTAKKLELKKNGNWQWLSKGHWDVGDVGAGTIAEAEPLVKFSGMFLASGARAETAIDPAKRELTAEERSKIDTASGWARLAQRGNSREYRLLGANAIAGMAERHVAKQHLLSAEELKECRTAAITLAGSKESSVRLAGLTALAAVADDSCLNVLVQTVKSRDADGREPELAVEAIERASSPSAAAALKDLARVVRDESLREKVGASLDRLSRAGVTPRR